jgi:16S rRNA processing protein RimM
VVSYTTPVDNLLDYLPWYLARDRHWQPANVVEARRHGKGLVARLTGCDDRDAAALLKGLSIGIRREQLPEAGDNEYYWHDLVGLQVQTTQGMALGTVDHLLETGANDVLVVHGERERLIPFIQGQVVVSIDLDAGVIQVDWDPEF